MKGCIVWARPLSLLRIFKVQCDGISVKLQRISGFRRWGIMFTNVTLATFSAASKTPFTWWLITFNHSTLVREYIYLSKLRLPFVHFGMNRRIFIWIILEGFSRAWLLLSPSGLNSREDESARGLCNDILLPTWEHLGCSMSYANDSTHFYILARSRRCLMNRH